MERLIFFFLFQHMGAQLGQEISKPLWTVGRCNPSLAVLIPPPILSLSQACNDQTVTCGKNHAFRMQMSREEDA